MTEKFPSTGFKEMESVVFTHGQLRQVLSAYAEGVLQKNWRDYTIISEKGQTTFCVIERGQGAPAAVIYSISATRPGKNNGKIFFRVYDGDRMVFRSEIFLESLQIFRDIGMPGSKKMKSFKVVK